MDETTRHRTKTNRKRALRAAFVVTASAGALAATGCESSISNPPFAECPAQAPASGGSCDEPGMECIYPDECDLEIVASCEDEGTWDVQYAGTCNPPPPPVDCPVEPPATGEACSDPIECTYPFDACGNQQHASCDGNAWTVTIEVVDGCEPPPCGAYADASLCVADASCRWLVPGCSEGPTILFEPGCHPIEDCAPETCDGAETCTAVVYDPCHGQKCNACGAEASICLP